MLTKPSALQKGDRVGIFTPSTPGHVHFRAKYQHGLQNIRNLGFEIVEGRLTRTCQAQGYRTAGPEERANELMELIEDDSVRAIVATIGGWNSASLIPFLDLDIISKNPKVICGYSDITTLHMALLTKAKLSSFYGPAVVPSFGEWPHMSPITKESFLASVCGNGRFPLDISRPDLWSNDFLDARTEEWRSRKRQFCPNEGWFVIRPGKAIGPAIIANVNSLVTLAGTEYFPNFAGAVLFLEDMHSPLSLVERRLRQIDMLGVFDDIKGLVFSKSERFDDEGAKMGYYELALEIISNGRDYPIVGDFDCGHTHPMITLAQGVSVSISASSAGEIASVTILERPVL